MPGLVGQPRGARGSGVLTLPPPQKDGAPLAPMNAGGPGALRSPLRSECCKQSPGANDFAGRCEWRSGLRTRSHSSGARSALQPDHIDCQRKPSQVYSEVSPPGLNWEFLPRQRVRDGSRSLGKARRAPKALSRRRAPRASARARGTACHWSSRGKRERRGSPFARRATLFSPLGPRSPSLEGQQRRAAPPLPNLSG